MRSRSSCEKRRSQTDTGQRQRAHKNRPFNLYHHIKRHSADCHSGFLEEEPNPLHPRLRMLLFARLSVNQDGAVRCIHISELPRPKSRKTRAEIRLRFRPREFDGLQARGSSRTRPLCGWLMQRHKQRYINCVGAPPARLRHMRRRHKHTSASGWQECLLKRLKGTWERKDEERLTTNLKIKCLWLQLCLQTSFFKRETSRDEKLNIEMVFGRRDPQTAGANQRLFSVLLRGRGKQIVLEDST